MKYHQVKRLNIVFLAAGVVALVLACTTQTATASAPGPALVASGFRAKPATTHAQREQLRTMPEDTFTVVKQGSETYYLYPDKRAGQLYAGDHHAYEQYLRYAKMQHDRQEGAFVIDVKPRGRPVITVWHGWSPFREW